MAARIAPHLTGHRIWSMGGTSRAIIEVDGEAVVVEEEARMLLGAPERRPARRAR
jgi:hypothetical protein